MAEQIKVTQAKHDELAARLKYLETEERTKVAEAILKAKEFGDLSENAEYSAAKDAQVKLETEIARLNDTLMNLVIIDESSISTDVVSLGTVVKVKKANVAEPIVYKLVSKMEVNSKENKISDQSPVGKALMGHKTGDKVTAVTPNGSVAIEILAIEK